MKIRKLLRIRILLFLVTCCWTSFSYAQDDPHERTGLWTAFTDTFDGYFETEVSTRLEELDYLTRLKNNLRLKFEPDLGEHISLKLDVIGSYDAACDLNDDLECPDDDKYRADAQIREALLGVSFDTFDLQLGWQQVVWEVTDRLQLLDIVNPLDLHTFVLKDFDLIRIPLWMVNFKYYFTFDYSLQILIIPDMSFTELAETGSEWAFNVERPSGIQPIIHDADEPDINLENSRYGLRFKGLAGGWDFTLNYLYTWDHLPVQKKTLDLTDGTLTVTPEYERMHLIGGSMVNVLWDTVVRAEVAAYLDGCYNVDDITVSDMVVQKDSLNYALAFERDLFDITWLAQGAQRVILDYDDAISDEQISTTLTLRGSKHLNDEETIELTVTGIYRVHDEDYALRSKIEYDLTDSWRLTGGIDLFGGGDDYSFFGQFDENDRLYAEVRYSF